jgi:hypothetical protein
VFARAGVNFLPNAFNKKNIANLKWNGIANLKLHLKMGIK